MLLGTLGASLLGNLLTGQGINRAGKGRGINRAGKTFVSIGYGNGFLMPLNPLTNFEIQKYYQNESRFNGIYSRDNLPNVKDGAYVINLDEDTDIGTHSVALYVQSNNVTYFDYFGEEHIPKEIKTFIGRSLSIATSIFRLQGYESIM